MYLGNVRALGTDGVATHSSSAALGAARSSLSLSSSGNGCPSFQMLGPETWSPPCLPHMHAPLGQVRHLCLQRTPRTRSLLTTPSSPAQLMSLTVTTALAFDAFDPFDRDAWLCRPPPPVINRAARGISLLHKIRPHHLSAQGLLLASPPEQKAKPQVTCEDTHGARSHSPWLLITRAAHSPSCP